MKDVQRIAIVDPSDSTRETLRNLLLGLETVWLEAECSRYEFFGDVIQQSKPDVALVALDADPARGLQLITQLSVDVPYMPILAVSSRTDGQFILQTLRSGAKEFLTQPLVLEELLTATQRIRAQTRSRSSEMINPLAQGKIIAVAGSRGGIGATSLAVNLGCALAEDKHHSVALIDLDLALGDADVSLDLMPNYTLADVAMNIDRLDMTFLRRSLSKHSSGLSLLPHPVQLEDVTLVQEEHLNRVIGLLRASYTHIVLDLSKSFRPTDFAAIMLANVVLLVAQLELSSLRNVVRLLMSFKNLEGVDEKLRVVLTRVGADDQEISLGKAEETVGRPIYWQVPNDHKAMLGCRSGGIPLVQYAPKSKIYQSIRGLAAAVGGKNEPAETNGEKSDKKEKRGFSLFGSKT